MTHFYGIIFLTLTQISQIKVACALTRTVSFVLCMYLGLSDAGVSVQLTVVYIGSAVTATHPVLCHVTPLQRKEGIIRGFPKNGLHNKT